MAKQSGYREQTYHKGDVLFSEGDKAGELFILKYGEVEIYKKDRKGNNVLIDTIGEGNVVGEMALFDNNFRSATVKARGVTRVICVSKKEFMRKVDKMPTWLSSIVKIIIKRLRLSNERYTESTGREATPGIVYFLTFLVERYAKPDQKSVSMNTDTVTREIRNVLDIEYNAVEQCYEELERKSIVCFDSKKMIIPEPHLLMEYFRFKKGLLKADSLPRLSRGAVRLIRSILKYGETYGKTKENRQEIPLLMFSKDYARLSTNTLSQAELKELTDAGLVAIDAENKSPAANSSEEDQTLVAYTDKVDVYFKKAEMLEKFMR